MNERIGEVFSVAAENAPVPGCTVSKAVAVVEGCAVSHFALAAGTDISAETYGYHKLWLVLSGTGAAYTAGGATRTLSEGDAYLTPIGEPVGVRTSEGLVYTEIELQKGYPMKLTPGEVFALKDVLPYAEGRIVNKDLINDPKLKFVLMSFAAGTGLSEHAAPGAALIFALDGEGLIGYEGHEYTLKAGENFVFAKNGAHWVKALKPFKMALLLTLD